jgi:hypothetical protein
MPKNIAVALVSGLVLSVVALLPLGEAAATGDAGVSLPTGAGAAPLRSCTIATTYPAGSVQIKAGPGPAGTPFPLTVTSSTDLNCPIAAGTCLRWDYQWIYTGVPPSATFVTLDSDLNLLNVLGTSVRVSAPGGGDLLGPIGINAEEVRVVRTITNQWTYQASLFTATNAQVGKVTAGFRSGLKAGFCEIQGAEKPTADALLSSPKTVTTTVGACTVQWTLSPDGCTTNAQIVSPSALGCAAAPTPRDLVINGQVAATATCGTEIGGPFGSTEVCRWNSLLRKATCVTVP